MRVHFEMRVELSTSEVGVVGQTLFQHRTLDFPVLPGMWIEPAEGWAAVEVGLVFVMSNGELCVRLKRLSVTSAEIEDLYAAGWGAGLDS